jgi:hypothetical protein
MKDESVATSSRKPVAPATLRQFAVKLLKVLLVALCALGALGVQGSVFIFLTLELGLVAHPL